MNVEWLILADAAQVLGNKLYLLGGGWDTLRVANPFPVVQRYAVAVSFKIPWNETNQRHEVEIEVVDEDGQSIAKFGRNIEIGRPPGLPLGQEQRVQMAVDLVIELKKAGTYAVLAKIDGEVSNRATYTVAAPAGPPLQA